MSRPTVILWRNQYVQVGIAGLGDLARSGRPSVIDDLEVVVETLAAPPEHLGVTHWSARLLAKELGISFASVARIWRDNDVVEVQPADTGLRPSRLGRAALHHLRPPRLPLPRRPITTPRAPTPAGPARSPARPSPDASAPSSTPTTNPGSKPTDAYASYSPNSRPSPFRSSRPNCDQ